MNESPEVVRRSKGPDPSRKLQLVRLLGACLVLLTGVVFGHQFSGYQLHNFMYGAGVPPSHLPQLCRWFAFYSQWLMLMPPAILLVGTRRLLRDRVPSASVEVLVMATLLLTVVLVLGCLLAWQVPYSVSVGEVF